MPNTPPLEADDGAAALVSSQKRESSEAALGIRQMRPWDEIALGDITSLTRQDCREYLFRAGIERPSWEKERLIAQVTRMARIRDGLEDGTMEDVKNEGGNISKRERQIARQERQAQAEAAGVSSPPNPAQLSRPSAPRAPVQSAGGPMAPKNATTLFSAPVIAALKAFDTLDSVSKTDEFLNLISETLFRLPDAAGVGVDVQAAYRYIWQRCNTRRLKRVEAGEEKPFVVTRGSDGLVSAAAEAAARALLPRERVHAMNPQARMTRGYHGLTPLENDGADVEAGNPIVAGVNIASIGASMQKLRNHAEAIAVARQDTSDATAYRRAVYHDNDMADVEAAEEALKRYMLNAQLLESVMTGEAPPLAAGEDIGSKTPGLALQDAGALITAASALETDTDVVPSPAAKRPKPAMPDGEESLEHLDTIAVAAFARVNAVPASTAELAAYAQLGPSIEIGPSIEVGPSIEIV
ncbi:hypothetical protein NFJ02_07g129770 [Pycnococcus provasolii]